MFNSDCNRSVNHRQLAENTAYKRGNSLSLKSFVTFVVRNSAGALPDND
jgi:hypothetical protein